MTNKELQPLTDRQISEIEYIYKLLWQEYGTIGGAALWHDVIVKFLLKSGYKIEKVKSNV